MRTHKIEHAPMVRLGEYIENISIKNKENMKSVSGVNIFKEFMPTVADLTGTDISKYQVVPSNHFACNLMHIGRDIKIPIAFNYSSNSVVVSPAYEVFKVKDESKNDILSDYLIMFFKVNEIDRLCWFYTDSSIRGNLTWDRFCEIKIPLPSIETQKELVAVYNGLKELAEENEKLLEPLEESCQVFIVDCKKKYPMKRLGDMIEIDEKINFDNRDLEFLGINKDKVFMPSVATTDGLDKSKYKVITKGKFVFSGMQTGRDICIRFGLYNVAVDGLVSPAYTTYSVTDTNILPEFIMMNFKRSEMDRLGWFLSDSSVRSNLDFDRFHEIQIPLPPLEIQQKIVDLYNCYEECKRISTTAREKIKNLCPALVQKAAHSE